eukprot:4970696-Alexandrium_andersonii.AAC.1
MAAINEGKLFERHRVLHGTWEASSAPPGARSARPAARPGALLQAFAPEPELPDWGPPTDVWE